MQKKRWGARYLMTLNAKSMNVSSQVNSSHIPMQAYSNISMSHAEISSHIPSPNSELINVALGKEKRLGEPIWDEARNEKWMCRSHYSDF